MKTWSTKILDPNATKLWTKIQIDTREYERRFFKRLLDNIEFAVKPISLTELKFRKLVPSK